MGRFFFSKKNILSNGSSWQKINYIFSNDSNDSRMIHENVSGWPTTIPQDRGWLILTVFVLQASRGKPSVKVCTHGLSTHAIRSHMLWFLAPIFLRDVLFASSFQT